MSELLCHIVQPTHCILLLCRCCVLDAFRNEKKEKCCCGTGGQEQLILFKLYGTRISLSDSLTAVKTSTPEDTEVTGPMLCSCFRPSFFYPHLILSSLCGFNTQLMLEKILNCPFAKRDSLLSKENTKKQSSREVVRNKDLAITSLADASAPFVM